MTHSDLPSPADTSRLAAYGATTEDDEDDPGRILAVGVELPSGCVLATLIVPSTPVTFENVAELHATAASVADTHADDVWIEHVDEGAP